MSSKATLSKKPAGGGARKRDGKKGKAQAQKPQETGNKRQRGSNLSVEAAPIKKKGLFAKDLPLMMYGYGDAEKPYEETIELVEDILIDYITSLMTKANEVASGPNGKILVDDILHLLRKDKRKYARARELLDLNEEIARAKKVDGLGDESE